MIDLTQENRDAVVRITEEAIRQEAAQAEHEDRYGILAQLDDDDDMELNCKRMAVAQYFNKLMRDARK